MSAPSLQDIILNKFSAAVIHCTLSTESLHPTRHNVGHFRDVLLSQSLGLELKKLNLTQQKQITQEQNSLS